MTSWQLINAPRNKREKRVAKISRDIEHKRIINLIDKYCDNNHSALDNCYCSVLIFKFKEG